MVLFFFANQLGISPVFASKIAGRFMIRELQENDILSVEDAEKMISLLDGALGIPEEEVLFWYRCICPSPHYYLKGSAGIPVSDGNVPDRSEAEMLLNDLQEHGIISLARLHELLDEFDSFWAAALGRSEHRDMPASAGVHPVLP